MRANRARLGSSTFIGGMILFGIFSTILFGIVNVRYDSGRQIEDAYSARLSEEVAQQDEDFSIITDLFPDNETIGFTLRNTGPDLIQISSVFITAPSGRIAQKADGAGAIFNGSPLISISPGETSPMFNTSVSYPISQSGSIYKITILTQKGNLGNAAYPMKRISSDEVLGDLEEVGEAVLKDAIGDLLLDWDSFESCLPVTQNCEPTSADWVRGWQLNSNERVMFRLLVRNVGNRTLFISEKSVVSAIGPFNAASLGATVFNIKGTPTMSDNNGPPYTPDFGITIIPNSNTTLYFGATQPGGDQVEKITGKGMYWTVLILFAFEDVDGDSIYNPLVDTRPYSQSMTYQVSILVV